MYWYLDYLNPLVKYGLVPVLWVITAMPLVALIREVLIFPNDSGINSVSGLWKRIIAFRRNPELMAASEGCILGFLIFAAPTFVLTLECYG